MSTHKSILTEAEGLVHGDRNADYGNPLDEFSRVAKMWSAILETDVSAEQIGLCMVALKLSRQCNNPKRDNMVDAAGYAETVQMVVDERELRLSREKKYYAPGHLATSEHIEGIGVSNFGQKND